MRVARDPDRAILAELDVDPPEAAGIGGHRVVDDAVVDADHRSRAGAALGEIEAAGLAIDIVAQVNPDHRVQGVDLHLELHRKPVGNAGERVVGRMDRHLARRQPLDGRHHLALAIVEPVGGVALERVPAELAAEFEQLALADPDGAQRRQVIPPPLLRHANARPAHADQVVVVLVARLDPGGREDEGPLLVDVDRVAHVGRGLRVAAIRLVRLGEDEEAERAALVDHGHDQAVVGRVRIALIRAVVNEAVARLELRVMLPDRLAHQVRADQRVDRQALGRPQEPAIGRQDDTGKVVRGVEHARPRRPEKRVLHLPRNALDAVRDQCRPHALPAPAGAFQLRRRRAGDRCRLVHFLLPVLQPLPLMVRPAVRPAMPRWPPCRSRSTPSRHRR
jgi:hypothetical protein